MAMMPGMGGMPGAGAGSPMGQMPGQNPMDPKSMALQALMGSIETMQPEQMRPPGTPLPVQSPTNNPEFTKMILQAMMGSQGQGAPSLGSILGGS